MDRQPNFEPGVLVGRLPTVGDDAIQPLMEGIAGVPTFVAMLALHLTDKVERGPTLSNGPQRMMILEELRPIGTIRGPLAKVRQIRGPIGQRSRTPG